MLGPVANGGDAWQVTLIGYNPLTTDTAVPWLTDGLLAGPKNLGEGYRRNTPVMYYTFDPSFGDYFGSSGELAVEQAFDILNSLTNVDSYSAYLSEFPLNSESENYTANGLGLLDLKSTTMALILEQLGLADAVRYTWALHNRYTGAVGASCTPAAYNNSVGYEYSVIQRNFEYFLTPLSYISTNGQVGQYSPYVNGELYSYNIYENCGEALQSPPDADAIEIPLDPLHHNPPVASGLGEDGLIWGYFYTGLTRDDVAGLRWLYSSSNYFAPSAGYLESPAPGSQVIGTSGGGTTGQQLTTSSLAILSIMDPATLQTNVPGIVITSVTTNIANGRTNYIYTFANLVTNLPFFTNTTVITQIQTIEMGNIYGQPYPPTLFGTKTTTTTTTNISNVVSGDFYVIPTNSSCGLTVLATLSNIVVGTTNNLGTVTNLNPAAFLTNIISTNIITFSTNHVLSVQVCITSTNTATNAPAGNYQGVGRIRFVRVPDYDYLNGQFNPPIISRYTMTFMTNGTLVTNTFQRVVTRPDFVFAASDQTAGPSQIYNH